MTDKINQTDKEFSTSKFELPQIQNSLPFFCARNIQKNWDTVKLNFSLSLEKGTMTAILGPSGSGKSTVLRIIAGLEKSDCKDCSIIIDGTDISKLPASKRQIGMMSQNPALFSHMSVKQNIAYGLKCRHVPKKEIDAKVAEYLALVNLSGFENRSVQTLSGGEAQRVALARTMIVMPGLILFDEPFSALDTPLRKKLAHDIREIQKKTQFTGIIVTHDEDEAKSISDRIIKIEKGRLIYDSDSSQKP